MRTDATERIAARPASDAPDAERLAAGLAALGLEIPSTGQDRLLGYLRSLARWNGVYNLTSVRDPRDMVVVHLLDSLSIVPLVDAVVPTTVVDVGSGAGLPGIPLAIVRPALAITTVDAVAKKIAFQRQVKATLGLDRLAPLHARVESLAIAPPDLIVSRAYADLATMLRSVERAAGPATTVLAMKGAVPAREIDAVPAAWTVVAVQALDVPFLGAERCAVTLCRTTARTEQ